MKIELDLDPSQFEKSFDTKFLDQISANIRLVEQNLKGCPFDHKVGTLKWSESSQRLMYDDDYSYRPFIETKALVRINNYRYLKQLFDEIHEINESELKV